MRRSSCIALTAMFLLGVSSLTERAEAGGVIDMECWKGIPPTFGPPITLGCTLDWHPGPPLQSGNNVWKNLTGESPETGDGALIWRPNVRDSAGNQLLAGHPVVFHERSPALGTKGDVVLADLSYYLVKDGSGPFVAASEHVHFTKNKTVIKVFWNVDGRPWLTAPLKLENGWEASPFVVLDVPAG